MSDWVHGGLLYGILLLLCTPIPGRDWPSSILTILLQFTGDVLAPRHRTRQYRPAIEKHRRTHSQGFHLTGQF
jgi:hypothetical protein